MTTKIKYPSFILYGSGTLRMILPDVWDDKTKKQRREHFRQYGYNVNIECAHNTFARIHTTTKKELIKALNKAFPKVEKRIKEQGSTYGR